VALYFDTFRWILCILGRSALAKLRLKEKLPPNESRPVARLLFHIEAQWPISVKHVWLVSLSRAGHVLLLSVS
jgi:hypothetical protein